MPISILIILNMIYCVMYQDQYSILLIDEIAKSKVKAIF